MQKIANPPTAMQRAVPRPSDERFEEVRVEAERSLLHHHRRLRRLEQHVHRRSPRAVIVRQGVGLLEAEALVEAGGAGVGRFHFQVDPPHAALS